MGTDNRENCIHAGQQSRVEWIDLAKGITILLVIIGHTVSGILRGAIFSFHMPLFFILSGMTTKYSTSGSQFLRKTEHTFRRFIVPAFVMFGLSTFIWILQNHSLFTDVNFIYEYVKKSLLTVTFSSGVIVQVMASQIPAIGIPWFFVVLFCGKSLFDYMNLKFNRKKLLMLCIILSVIGVAFGRIQWLPLSFDITLAILPFFFVGKEFERFHIERKPLLKFIISTEIWAILSLISFLRDDSYMALAGRTYPLYPLCYATAIAGTLMVSEFCVMMCRLKKIAKPILYIGKNSLYMLCIHILDYYLLVGIWKCTDNSYINAVCRVFVDTIFFLIFMFVLESIKKHKCQHSTKYDTKNQLITNIM